MGVLEEVSQMYDRILIDSPPVLNVTDACILGAVCDGTVLVVHAEKTARKSAEQACDNLFSVGTNVLGVVVNDVSPAKNRYGYYGSYKYYSYRYGDSSTGRESAEDVSPKPVVIKTQAENINQYHGPSRNEKKLSRSSGTSKSDSDKNE
jgi:Mrp family chromosome partitioning ATPase